jgi:hypothetical protein
MTRHDLIEGHFVDAMTSPLSQEQFQMFFVLVTGKRVVHVDRDAIKQLVRIGSDMIFTCQELYTSATLPRVLRTFVEALEELLVCTDDLRVQQLLLLVQYHLEKGVRYIVRKNIIFAQGCSGGHYIVPYVAPMEDVADVLAPRPPEYSIVGYARAILAVVNKIMTSST